MRATVTILAVPRHRAAGALHSYLWPCMHANRLSRLCAACKHPFSSCKACRPSPALPATMHALASFIGHQGIVAPHQWAGRPRGWTAGSDIFILYFRVQG